jgi:hypothetical protein
MSEEKVHLVIALICVEIGESQSPIFIVPKDNDMKSVLVQMYFWEESSKRRGLYKSALLLRKEPAKG